LATIICAESNHGARHILERNQRFQRGEIVFLLTKKWHGECL
jgi:hypothetical protein